MEKSLYPHPSKYKFWQHLEKDYTFARGATELLIRLVQQMNSLDQRLEFLTRKKKGEKIYETFEGIKNLVNIGNYGRDKN